MKMPESQILEQDGKLAVSVEYINWLENERRRINSVDLDKIEFFDGEKLDIPEKKIKRWKFVGMSNVCFITTDFYREDYDDDDFWDVVV